MDANALFQIFTASFHQDPNVRISAELELRKLEPQEGLLPTLLQLISPTSTYTPVVRLAAAIYLKNRITSSWRVPHAPSAFGPKPAAMPYTPIPPSDRQALKTNILPLLAALAVDPQSGSVKSQMAAVLSRVVDADFPEDWPGLVEEIGVLLGGAEGEVEAGLRATVEVLRGFRYTRKDPDSTILSSLVTHLFPQVLHLAQHILASSPTTPIALTQQGTLLHLVLKAYKNSISSRLSPALQAEASIVPWATLFLAVVQRPLSPALLPEDSDAREKHEWSKSKKWALYALNRLFTRYGNPSQLPSNMKAPYGAFAERFVGQVVPEMFRTYLGVVERIVGGEWEASKAKHHILAFFEECIKPKSTWALLKPHVQPLVEQFAFPLICLTDDEIELFTEDPAEFARTHFGDFIEDSYSNPCATSLTFVAALVETRKATTLLPMLNFIQTVVSKYPAETTPKQKDGALRMLGSLAPTATKTKKIAPMMEAFFQAHVLPEFKSPHGFLRYRACEVVEKFESCDMDWDKKENLELMFRAVMEAVTDAELPVRIQAAIALPEIVRYTEVRAGMVPNIGRIMQELLKLANEVDLDALTNTTRALVAEFSEEVAPFAVELTEQLTESYRRLVQESLETRDKEDEDGYGSYEEEKTLVCMNILKTIDQLVSSLEAAPGSLDQVEAIIAPALEFTVRNNLVELFDEVFEILDSLSFFQKKISPAMWPLFEATYHAFMGEASDYFNEMFGCIDNLIAFGSETFAVNGDYRRMLLDMFNTLMTSRSLGAEDRCTACKLGESMLLNLRGNIDEAIPPIIERAMACVLSKNDDEAFVVTSSLFLHSLELVVTAIFYNPSPALAILDGHDWTQQFFSMWFKHLGKYSRVHDRKLCIGAICAILEWLAEGNGAPLAQSSGQLVVGALQIFKEFPEALQSRVDLEKAFAEGGDDDDDDDDDEELLIDDDDEDEENDVLDTSSDYLQMLEQAKAAGGDDDDDDADSAWSEEILWASPLDELDIYKKFTATLTAIESSSPALFQLATQNLDGNQRTELAALATRAQAGGEKAGLEDQSLVTA